MVNKHNPKNEQIKWRGKTLGYHELFEQASKKEGGGYRETYKVLGFKNSQKGYEPIPIKLQKNCRAFLKGTGRKTGISGLSRIVFSKK